jgi:hypothetical protein
MASFTDIIPQFNPYVQQLPVEAMVQVGMEKQKRYDEGIQKIQSQIDQIGGMDIYKPVHRMYLQSKLNELGNNLKLVAAGDFSNFQLVNSVGGMIGQVVKDPVVKNAYESTQLLRKQQGYMEEAKRAGKSSPENEWWFMSEIDRWQNDPDLMKKFSGEYIQYTDVDKKLRDVASKIKEIEKSIDIPYQRNADGSYRLDKNGNPIVDDAMLRIKVKGTPAEKILNNFYSSLDENDKRQLMITGNYHYRGADKVTFQNDIISTYNSQKKALTDNLSKLAVELKTNDNLTSAQRAEIEAAINKGVDKISSGFFEKEVATKINEIDKVQNMEDFKYRLYTQKYLTGLAQDLSNQSYTEEILSNPYAQMAMEKKKLEFQVQRARQEHQEFLMSYAQRERSQAFEEFKWKTEQKEKADEKAALAPKTQYMGLGTDAPPPSMADLDIFIEKGAQDIVNLRATAGPELFPKFNGPDGKPLTGTALYEAQQKALDGLINDYITNPKSIKDNDQRVFVEQMRELQQDQIRRANLFNGGIAVGAKYDEQLKATFGKYSGGKAENGVNYTAQELYEARAALEKFINVEKVSAKSERAPNITVNTAGYLNSLPARLRPLGQLMVDGFEGKKLSTTGATTFKQATNLVTNLRSGEVANIVSQKLKAQSDYLAANMPEVQVTSGALNMDNKVTAKNVEFLIGNATRFYDQFGYLDQENPSDFSPSTISDMRTGEGAKELRYIAERNYDGSGRLLVYDKNNRKQIIPLSQSDLMTYFPDVAQTSFMTRVKFDIMSSPGRTTNVMGRENPIGAKYSGYTIPGLSNSQYAPRVRWDVEGAKGNNGGEYDRFQVRLYVFDGNTWKDDILNQQGHVSAAGVEDILSQIGPVTVEEVLRKK